MSATGRGFTLLELLVVLAILALLLTTLPIAMDRIFPSQRLRVAALDLAGELAALRERASLEHDVREFELLADGRHWRLVGESGDHSLPAAVRATLRSVGGSPTTSIRFYPDGSSTGGVLSLTVTAKRERIVVSALTGRIHRVVGR